MKNFLSVHDVKDVHELIAQAQYFKKNPFADRIGLNKTMTLLFFNPSLRTRLSTQVAGQNLGMQVISMDVGQTWGIEFQTGAVMDEDKAEHIIEAAKVVSSYSHLIGIRSFAGLKDREEDYKDMVINRFADLSLCPVINLESAIRHPLQSLTDAITIQTYKQVARPRVVLTWAPHPRALPQAVANSFIEWMQSLDVELVVTHPPGFELDPQFSKNVRVEYDQNAAFKGAHFIYAKNWSGVTNYGQTALELRSWTVTPAKMATTDQAYFMHCLPVRRNVIVEDAVLDGPKSLIIPQAANRVCAAQSVIASLLHAGS